MFQLHIITEETIAIVIDKMKANIFSLSIIFIETYINERVLLKFLRS